MVEAPKCLPKRDVEPVCLGKGGGGGRALAANCTCTGPASTQLCSGTLTLCAQREAKRVLKLPKAPFGPPTHRVPN